MFPRVIRGKPKKSLQQYMLLLITWMHKIPRLAARFMYSTTDKKDWHIKSQTSKAASKIYDRALLPFQACVCCSVSRMLKLSAQSNLTIRRWQTTYYKSAS